MMPELQFLFRFRDLVARTIEAHQEIISDKGSCWWGWWKRPSEDSRTDVWSRLAASASNSTPQTVGLFDSGTGIVYQALVTEVVVPSDESLGNPVASLPDNERERVPLYYRESPFSRAWMRITEIKLLPNFFGNYSYDVAPVLPNYTASTLKRFIGKRIIGPDELRGMDTTIWRVRPAREEDPAEKIVLTVPAIPAAVSSEAVRCKSNRILHITDPHFSLDAHRKRHVWRLEGESDSTSHTMADAIAEALIDKPVGAVLLTGDLTFLGSASEFAAARVSITKLLGQLDLGVDNLMVIPGNHDIQWGTTNDYSNGAEVISAPEEAKANYKQFYTDLFRHDPSPHLSMARRFLLPCGLVFEVAALNSSSLSTGKKFLAGMGKTDEAGWAEASAALGWKTKSTLALRTLAIHHHLTVTEDIEPASGYYQGYGMAVDAVRLQRLAASHRVQLALHGHKHRAFVWRSSVYELPEHAHKQYKVGEISIVGGGSSGSEETESYRNYFNVLDFSPGRLCLEIWRSQNKGTFTPMNEFIAPLGYDPDGNGLVLGDWQGARD